VARRLAPAPPDERAGAPAEPGAFDPVGAASAREDPLGVDVDALDGGRAVRQRIQLER
jgi:hypothetical protein